METTLFILVSILIVFIVILIITLGVVGFKFLKLKEKELASAQNSSRLKSVETLSHDSIENPETKKEDSFKIQRSAVSQDLLKALKTRQSGGHFCLDHPEEYSLGLCAISGEPYCEKCLSVQSDIKVAKKYLDIYLDNKWVEVLMMPNSSISPAMIERLVNVKEELWDKESLPLIVQGHHKINVDTDEIEIYTVIFARDEDRDYIKGEISFVN